MLILNRRWQESIYLLPKAYPDEGSPVLDEVFGHGPVSVHTKGVHRRSVSLGIKAPWALKVVRGERLGRGEWGPLPATGENGFLVFKRKSGQSFDLMPADGVDLERTTLGEFLAGGAIGICVLGIKEGMVSYGICAPPAVKILRDDAIDRVGHQTVANWD